MTSDLSDKLQCKLARGIFRWVEMKTVQREDFLYNFW